MLIVLGLALGLAPQDPPPVQDPPDDMQVAPLEVALPALMYLPMFAGPYETEQRMRLALTPKMDGVIAPEEWQSLVPTAVGGTYFQWEPERLFWAARATAGQDIVLSLDYNGNGWLVGDDNLEVRVSRTAGGETIGVRQLDATDRIAPQWRDGGIVPEAIRLVTREDGDGWVLEASFTPPRNIGPREGRETGARVDVVAQDADLGPAYMPRTMAFMQLRFDNSSALPPGFSWRPEFRVRSVPTVDRLRARIAFQREADTVNFQSLEFRGEGYLQGLVAAGNIPFPPFDRRNRSAFDYDTVIAPEATVGWRVLRTELVGVDGGRTVLRSSVRVADLVDFDIDLPTSLEASPEARIVRGSVTIRSNGMGRVEGQYTLTVPSTWTATRGKEERFLIYHSRGSSRIGLEMIVPQGAQGVFPVTFRAVIGDREIATTIFIPVQ